MLQPRWEILSSSSIPLIQRILRYRRRAMRFIFIVNTRIEQNDVDQHLDTNLKYRWWQKEMKETK